MHNIVKKLTKRSNQTIFSFSYFDTVCILIMLILNLNYKILISKHVSKDLSIHFFKTFEWLGSNMALLIKRTPLSTNRCKDKNKMTKTGIFDIFQQKY